MATLIDDLYAQLAHFSPTETRIARVILADPQAVVNITIADLAKLAGTSDASVSRFCRQIGLSGFHELKVTLAALPKRAPTPKPTSLHQALAGIYQNKAAELNATFNIPDASLQPVLTALTQASVIQVAASGGTQPVAADAVYKFNQLGKLSFTAGSFALAMAQVQSLPTDALLVVISNSGETKNLLTLIETAHKRQIKVLAITNQKASPIAENSDWHLETAAHQQHFAASYYFSRVAAMGLIEALFLLLQGQHPEFRAHILAHEDSIVQEKN